MPARLKALGGPVAGTEWPLSERTFTIGRGQANSLCLANDAGASKRHCLILEQDRNYTICDLDSHNHTFVNDVEIHQAELGHGDQIRIGHSTFVFLAVDQSLPARPQAVDFDDGRQLSGSTV